MTIIRRPSWTRDKEEQYLDIVGSHVDDPKRRRHYERSAASDTITDDWAHASQKFRANCCFRIRCLESVNKIDLRYLSQCIDEMQTRIERYLYGTSFIRYDRSTFCGFIVTEKDVVVISYRVWVHEHKLSKYIQAVRDIVPHYINRGSLVGYVDTPESVGSVLKYSPIWQDARAGDADLYFHRRQFEL